MLPWYIPNSAMPENLQQQFNNLVANQTPLSLLRLAETINSSNSHQIPNIEQFCTKKTHIDYAEKLSKNLIKHGSDKSEKHNYHLIYGTILAELKATPRILEIGLGSNNTDIPSNMSADGKPGASLRAFRALLPKSIIDGADIDPTIQVDGCRIFHIDQTDSSSFEKISQLGSNKYDLIIDDGLHAPNANFNTLEFALRHISSEGIIVVEDIPERAVHLWLIVTLLMKSSPYKCHIIRTKVDFIFVCYFRSANIFSCP